MALDRPRRGRPRADQAGLREERVLDAATALFLDQGFERTTFDQLSALAPASKTTLYARFPSKEVLFEAVVLRMVRQVIGRLTIAPGDRSLEKRLVKVGIEVADKFLVPEVIALMRVTAAEAGRFPNLAREGYRVGFGGIVDFVAGAIAGRWSGEAVSAATPTAVRFLELALQPLQMKALFGADLAELRARAADDIREVVAMMAVTGALKGQPSPPD